MTGEDWEKKGMRALRAKKGPCQERKIGRGTRGENLKDRGPLTFEPKQKKQTTPVIGGGTPPVTSKEEVPGD